MNNKITLLINNDGDIDMDVSIENINAFGALLINFLNGKLDSNIIDAVVSSLEENGRKDDADLLYKMCMEVIMTNSNSSSYIPMRANDYKAWTRSVKNAT